MVRSIAAVIVGYLTMAVAIIVSFSAISPVLGVDRLFVSGTYDAAGGWIALSFLLGLTGAMAGGWMCARLAPRASVALWLAAVVVVLGVLLAIPAVRSSDPSRGGPRPVDASVSDAMAHATQPGWAALLNPLIGAVGVLMGAGLRQRTS